MIKKCYPNGKTKAFSISYDDGVEQDVRIVDILNRYGLKGTFNLNSGLLLQDFRWTHESGMVVRRLPPSVIKDLYRGHEVASHTFSHPYLESLSPLEVMKEMASDKCLLEQLTGMEIAGFATPFLYYSSGIAECARACGFEYARISEETGNYRLSADPYFWRGGKFHWDDDLDQYVDGFLSCEDELTLCQLVGHSYDLDVMDSWEQMEDIFRRVSKCADVAAMTNLQIVRYQAAMNAADIREDQICNNAQEPIWFQVDGKVVCIQPGEKYIIKD